MRQLDKKRKLLNICLPGLVLIFLTGCAPQMQQATTPQFPLTPQAQLQSEAGFQYQPDSRQRNPKKTYQQHAHISPSPTPYAKSGNVEERLLREFKSWEGTPHKLGGTGRSGIDCSAFTQRMYENVFHMDLPRTTSQQSRVGRPITRGVLQAGDLVFFRQPDHVGIYLSHNEFIHASKKRGVIKSEISPVYWEGKYRTARRVLSEKKETATVKPVRQETIVSTQYGKASYYSSALHGRQTANGERYNQYKFTAAHKKLPFGSLCRITNLNNGKTVKVRINDRGPFVKGRIVDLSYVAMQQLGAIRAGVIDVKLEVLN